MWKKRKWKDHIKSYIDEVLLGALYLEPIDLTDNLTETLVEVNAEMYSKTKRYKVGTIIASKDSDFDEELSQLYGQYNVIYTDFDHFPSDIVIVVADAKLVEDIPITRVYKGDKSKVIIDPLLVKKIVKKTFIDHGEN